MNSSHQRPKILLIGDSITEQSFSVQHHGWGAALADWYGRTVDVVNRGYSGYNSRWMKILVPKLFPEKDSSGLFSTILLGSNDCSSGEQHVPVEEYKQNLLHIIRHCQWVNPEMNIILITPATVDTALWPDRNPAAAALYARKVIELGHELSKEGNKVQVISLWEDSELNLPEDVDIHRWWGAGNAPEYLRPIRVGDDLYDGLHFGIGGNEVLFQQLKGCILNRFPRSSVPVIAADTSSTTQVDYLQKHFPHWSELISCENETQISAKISSWSW